MKITEDELKQKGWEIAPSGTLTRKGQFHFLLVPPDGSLPKNVLYHYDRAKKRVGCYEVKNA